MRFSSSEREHWNQKYRDAPEAWVEPDPFLPRAFAEYIRPSLPAGGHALDLAGGAGRHSIWLAEQGWEVTLIDISETGVEQARRNAGVGASRVHFVIDDLTGFAASQTQFDVVMAFFFLDRRIFTEIVKAIRPGGLLVYKALTLAQLKLAERSERSGAFTGGWRTAATGGWAGSIALPGGGREEGYGGTGGEEKSCVENFGIQLLRALAAFQSGAGHRT